MFPAATPTPPTADGVANGKESPSPTIVDVVDNSPKSKPSVNTLIEKSDDSSLEVGVEPVDSDVPEVDEKALLRKMDMALIPWPTFLYLLTFLGRTGIGKHVMPYGLYDLDKDLGLTDQQYLLSLTIFFISYSVFEVPSNILLKRLQPRIWLSLMMLIWGLVMLSQAFVRDFPQLMAVRWLLGMFEAGLFPGVSYYLSCWYKRSEYGVRAAVFFSGGTIAGAFGGLLAAAISKMDGIGGKPAWAWIFILEGALTVLVSVASFFIVQDFPETAKFLTEPERAAVIRRLQSDDQFSAGGETFKKKYLWQSLCDWKTWISMVIYMTCCMPLYAFALFLPSIIQQLGFKATPANLLTAPVYLLAGIVTCGGALVVHRWGHRGYFNIAFMSLGIVGYILLITSRNTGLSYFAVFVAICGIYPTVPNTIAWISNNVEGSYKRSVSLAMVISLGNINGAVGSNIYRAKDRPFYTFGHGIVLMYLGIGIIVSGLYLFLLKRENAKRDRGERDEVIGKVAEDVVEKSPNGNFATVEDAKRAKGDLWSGYRYVL